jgi:3-keto-L-gulonate-6-phosphate decarboxylase
MAITFEEVVETIKQLPAEQQQMLVDLIRAWHVDERRREIARDAKVSLAAFHRGTLESQSAEGVIAQLRQSVDDRE